MAVSNPEPTTPDTGDVDRAKRQRSTHGDDIALNDAELATLVPVYLRRREALDKLRQLLSAEDEPAIGFGVTVGRRQP